MNQQDPQPVPDPAIPDLEPVNLQAVAGDMGGTAASQAAPFAETPYAASPLGAVPREESFLARANRLLRSEPIRVREILAVVLLVVLADLTVYRGEGFAGFSVLFLLGPVLLWLGSCQKLSAFALVVVSTLLFPVAIKLFLCGTVLAVVCGFGLLIAFAMSVSGRVPFIGEGIVFATQAIAAGVIAIQNYARRILSLGLPESRFPLVNVLLPAAAVVVFSTIFTFANPDFLDFVAKQLQLFSTRIYEWLIRVAPGEFFCWAATAWISLGLMKPIALRIREKVVQATSASEPVHSKLLPAIRNMLLAVIGLFAIYLVAEFSTLWGREFPAGFYYAGYAHEGAAWLTLALGLATIMLSTIFRGRMLGDQRLPGLKRLAWIWSAQNLLLTLAVYNRLMIYVNFNGMTRMRVIGLLGITCVVIGFIIVLVKISRRKSFGWLFQRQVLTVALAVVLFAVLPVDWLVQRYNISQILAGDLAPAVQITEHPIDDTGMLAIMPLVDCQDPKIREGVRAMLAGHEIAMHAKHEDRSVAGWTAVQLLDRFALRKMEANNAKWATYSSNASLRDSAIDDFREYAYQWY